MNKALNAAIEYFISSRLDVFGFCVALGEPPDKSLRDQNTAKVFYRLQLAQNLVITPAVQMLIDSALNPIREYLFELVYPKYIIESINFICITYCI